MANQPKTIKQMTIWKGANRDEKTCLSCADQDFGGNSSPLLRFGTHNQARCFYQRWLDYLRLVFRYQPRLACNVGLEEPQVFETWQSHRWYTRYCNRLDYKI